MSIINQQETMFMAPQNDPITPQSTPTPIPDNPPQPQPVTSFQSQPSLQQTTLDPDNEPPVETTPPVFTPVSSPTRFSKKKKIIFGSTVAAVAVLLAGASAFAFWYNKPENVIAHSLQNIMTAKNGSFNGSVNVTPTQDEGNFKLSFSGASNDALESNIKFDASAQIESQDYALKAEIATDRDSNTYIKVQDVRTMAEDYFGMLGMIDTTMFDGLIDKFDNKWVVITKDDLKELSKESGEQRICAEDSLKKFSTDKNQQRQLADAYKANTFIVIKENKGTETIDGVMSNHYVVDLNYSKLRTFSDAAVQTDIFKALDNCYDGELSQDYNASKDDIKPPKGTNNTTYEIWVGTLRHQLTKLKISGSDEDATGSAELTTKFNNNPAVTIPKGETTVQDIEDEFKTLEQSFANPVDDDSFMAEDGFSTDVLGLSTLLN